jgi:two-component system C4-dicarboxylate transport response regulator DctD
MIRFDETTVGYDLAEAREQESRTSEITFPDHACQERVMSNLPNGLVVSSDDEVRRELAEILGHGGLAPVLASTVAESRTALVRHKVCIILCDEFVVDGDYRAVVEVVEHADTNVPVIVVSRTGDWPEYLAAIRGGVFDYLAYPPFPRELQRVIRNAFLERE